MRDPDQLLKPPKLARFIVACSVKKEMKDDALVNFDERYGEILHEFGEGYANVWAWQQAAQSFPYRLLLPLSPLVPFIVAGAHRILS